MKLSSLRQVGEKREKEFQKLGIYQAEDLVKYFPRAYLDLTERASLKTAYHNDMVLIGCEVTRLAPTNFNSRVKIVKAFCSQDGFPFTAVWFNQPYVAQKLKVGEYLFYGRVQNKYGQISLVNPTFEPMDKNVRLKGIVPVYSLKGKLSQKIMRDAVKEAFALNEVFSDEIHIREKLTGMRVHVRLRQDGQTVRPTKKVLCFEEGIIVSKNGTIRPFIKNTTPNYDVYISYWNERKKDWESLEKQCRMQDLEFYFKDGKK